MLHRALFVFTQTSERSKIRILVSGARLVESVDKIKTLFQKVESLTDGVSLPVRVFCAKQPKQFGKRNTQNF